MVVEFVRRLGAARLALLCLGGGACSVQQVEQAQSRRVDLPARPPASAQPPAPFAAERIRYLASRQAEGALDAQYQFVSGGAEALVTAPLGHGFVTALSPEGVSLRPFGDDWSVALHLSAYGCEHEVDPLARRSAAPSVDRSRPHRAEYGWSTANGALREWYVSGPLGVEQGFTLDASPCRAAEDPEVARIDLRVEGLAPRLVGAGEQGTASVELVDAAGTTQLRYADLWAEDAAGRPLATSMSTDGERISLRVALAGARYPVTVDPLIYRQTSRLTQPGAQPGDNFGYQIKSDDHRAAISVRGRDQHRGMVLVYELMGDAWTLQATLAPADLSPNDEFGRELALEGDVLLVGAPQANGNTGAAYVYVRSGATWSLHKKLIGLGTGPGDYFGRAVALSGGQALIGAYGTNGSRGAVYHFDDTWTQQATLSAEDAAVNADFGIMVAFDDPYALIGSYRATAGGQANAGAAYAFKRSGTGWVQQQKLTANAPVASGYFGAGLSLKGAEALIGSYGYGASRGAVYYFTRSLERWLQQQIIVANGGAPGDGFGIALDRRDADLLVGAPSVAMTSTYSQGAAHLYRRVGNQWQPRQTLRVTDAPPSYGFYGGYGVSIVDERHFLVGGYQALGTRGSVVAFTGRLANGDPCAAAADCDSNVCVDGVCCNEPCDGSCAACALAQGASVDGTCTKFSPSSAAALGCAPLTCTGTSLECAACTDDGQCPGGGHCAADGTCRAPTPNGQPCDDRAGRDCLRGGCTVCGAGYCVDGLCCDAPCDDTCGSCLGAKTGQRDGLCAPIEAGADPDEECAADGAAGGCGADGTCSGGFACRSFAATGTVCGASFCQSGVVTGMQCDGNGGCQQRTGRSCEGYPCNPDGSACASSCVQDSDCASAAYYCSEQGQCLRKRSQGEVCAKASQCGSGHCADGVCCNSTCEGQCEACDRPNTVGSCVPVTGDPVGDRRPCGEGNVCSGRCNGGNRKACTMPGAGTPCGAPSCLGDHSVPAGSCDGSGTCMSARPGSCIPYTCAERSGQCLTSCSSDAECAAGSVCNLGAGRCVVTTMTCKDATTVIHPDGTLVSCAPYRCAAGACRDACALPLDCADGFTCETGTCVEDHGGSAGSGGSGGIAGSAGSAGGAGSAGSGSTRPDAGAGATAGGGGSGASADDGGCGCRLPGGRTKERRGAALAGLALALGVTWRRRRRGLGKLAG